MIAKIDLTDILIDHFKTLSDINGKLLILDFLLFLGFPIIPAVLSVIFHLSLNEGLITLLVTCLSIFAALLFNLLLLVYDIIRKPENRSTDPLSMEYVHLKMIYLKQIYANISFCILISILAVIILLIGYFSLSIPALNIVFFIITIYLLGIFLLTLFMVLKRVHILLTKEFTQVNNTREEANKQNKNDDKKT